MLSQLSTVTTWCYVVNASADDPKWLQFGHGFCGSDAETDRELVIVSVYLSVASVCRTSYSYVLTQRCCSADPVFSLSTEHGRS